VAIHLANINVPHLLCGDDPRGSFKVERNAKRPSKIVRRAQRQNAKRQLTGEQTWYGRVQSSIAAADHNTIDAGRHPADQGRQGLGILTSLVHELHAGAP
jgi:hypothetical protein